MYHKATFLVFGTFGYSGIDIDNDKKSGGFLIIIYIYSGGVPPKAPPIDYLNYLVGGDPLYPLLSVPIELLLGFRFFKGKKSGVPSHSRYTNTTGPLPWSFKSISYDGTTFHHMRWI